MERICEISDLSWVESNQAFGLDEDGYLRIRLGGIKSKLRHFTPRRPADLKPRILAFQSCVFKIEKIAKKLFSWRNFTLKKNLSFFWKCEISKKITHFFSKKVRFFGTFLRKLTQNPIQIHDFMKLPWFGKDSESTFWEKYQKIFFVVEKKCVGIIFHNFLANYQYFSAEKRPEGWMHLGHRIFMLFGI